MPDPNNILDTKTKTAWMCVPKVANGAVKRALLQARGLSVPEDEYNLHNHSSFNFVGTDILDAYSHYLRVAFVRNPFDRLVSCWADKCHKKGWWESIPMFGLRTGMSFNEFTRVVCAQTDVEQNIHYRPMSALLTHRELPVYNVLCRFERLGEDWKALQNTLSWLPDLPRHNPSGRKDWRTYYDDETRALVAWRYAADIVRFGYAENLNEECCDSSDGSVPRGLHGVGGEMAQPAQGCG